MPRFNEVFVASFYHCLMLLDYFFSEAFYFAAYHFNYSGDTFFSGQCTVYPTYTLCLQISHNLFTCVYLQ